MTGHTHTHSQSNWVPTHRKGSDEHPCTFPSCYTIDVTTVVIELNHFEVSKLMDDSGNHIHRREYPKRVDENHIWVTRGKLVRHPLHLSSGMPLPQFWLHSGEGVMLAITSAINLANRATGQFSTNTMSCPKRLHRNRVEHPANP